MGIFSKIKQIQSVPVFPFLGLSGWYIWSAAIPFAQIQTTRFTGIGLFVLLGATILHCANQNWKIRSIPANYHSIIWIWLIFALLPFADFWRWNHPLDALKLVQVHLPMVFLPFSLWQISESWPESWPQHSLKIFGISLVINVIISLGLGPAFIWQMLHSEHSAELSLAMQRPFYGLLLGASVWLLVPVIPKKLWIVSLFYLVFVLSFLALILAKFAIISLIISVFGFIVYFLWNQLETRNFRLIIISLLALFLMAGMWSFTKTKIFHDLSRKGSIQYETLGRTYSNSANTRLVIWKSAFQVLAKDKNWLFGLGTANAQEALDKEYEMENIYVYSAHFNAHNVLIYMWLQYGMVGLAFMVCLFLFFARVAMTSLGSSGFFLWFFLLLVSQTEVFFNREMGAHFFLWVSLVPFFLKLVKNETN